MAAQTKTEQNKTQQKNNKSHAQISRKGVKRKAWSVYLALSRRPIKMKNHHHLHYDHHYDQRQAAAKVCGMFPYATNSSSRLIN